MQLELQTRMRVAREREQLSKPVRFRIGDRADPQQPRNITLHLLRCPLHVVSSAQHDARALKQLTAGGGQLHSSRCAFEQAHTELAFKRLDMAADSRLAQMKPLGCPR